MALTSKKFSLKNLGCLIFRMKIWHNPGAAQEMFGCTPNDPDQIIPKCQYWLKIPVYKRIFKIKESGWKLHLHQFSS